MWFFIYIILGLICGFVTKSMNEEKGYEGGFWWGFFLDIVGIIVIAVRPYNPDRNKSKGEHKPVTRKDNDQYGLYVKTDFMRTEIMTEDEIEEWFKGKGYGDYLQTFKDNDLLDVKILKSLTEDDLEKLGIASMGKRKALLLLFSNDLYKETEFEGEKDSYLIQDGQVLSGENGQIQKRTYWNRNDLKSVIIEEGTHYIGVEAFKGCKNLNSVILPVSISTIDNSAFEDCHNLERIRFLGNKQQWSLVRRGLCWDNNVSRDFKISVKSKDGRDILL